jgi:Na+-transporting NADH:ubiquinone oxidoreductase subunit D
MTPLAPDSALQTLARPIVKENPILLQVLGICSALAVTRTLAPALTMAGAVTGVLIASNVIISTIRHQVPRSIRLIVQITIIASLVIVADQLLAAFAWEMSRQLTVFVSLIVTNCIVLGRAESFAMSHPPRASALDGLGNGLGYGLVLVFVAALRELIGAGTLLGTTVLPLASEGGWYEPTRLAQLPPSAFFIIALIIWVVRAARPTMVEPPKWNPADADEPRSRSAGPWIS